MMALVRENPLVWVWESDTWIACTDRGAYCVWDGPSGVRCGYPGSEAIPATDTADGKRICEQAWHETWLRDTYVPPLVWVDAGNNHMVSGRYVVHQQDDGWFADLGRDEAGLGEVRRVSDQQSGIDLCNHNNRRLVIGE